MKHYASISILIAALASGLLARAQTTAQSGTPSSEQEMTRASIVCGGPSTYDELTADERKPPPRRKINLGKSPIELTITTVDISTKLVDAKTASSFDFCEWHTIWNGVDVSTTGEAYGFANGEGEFRGGGGGKLPNEEIIRLKSLMNSLPDDHHRVPPITRRVIVEIFRDKSATVRLYDLGDLPGEILEMMRITGTSRAVVTPYFKPDRTLGLTETTSPYLGLQSNHLGRAVSPDGSLCVDDDYSEKTLNVYLGNTGGGCGGLTDGKVIHTIPEFWQRGADTYVSEIEFSPDGRYTLVTWGNKRIGAVLFDTTTWRQVTDPTVFPQNLKQYLHTPDWKLGIALTVTGETLVWDYREHRVLSRLPGLGEFEEQRDETDSRGHLIKEEKEGEIRSAVFSPDRTQVAIYSGPDNVYKLRLSIFDIRTGAKLRDLQPTQSRSCTDGEPVWWNDGRWLFSSFNPGYGGSNKYGGLWDVKTGHFLGTLDLSDCTDDPSPVATGAKLLQLCSEQKGQEARVLEWTVDGVQKEIESLKRLVLSGQDSQ